MSVLVKFYIQGLCLPSKAASFVVERFWNKMCFATRKENIQDSVPRLPAMNITICQMSDLSSKIKFTRYMLFMGSRVSWTQHSAWPIGSFWWMVREQSWYRAWQSRNLLLDIYLLQLFVLISAVASHTPSFPNYMHTKALTPDAPVFGSYCIFSAYECKIMSFWKESEEIVSVHGAHPSSSDVCFEMLLLILLW